MSISARQAELFAGESWQSIYQSFSRINFNATDPVSINRALQDYIRVNYPENFNDWIVSSEFVAIIDLLSWLAGTLAFRTDLAARENFIDTAEARESILRLARFLSYNPNRCQPATSVLKVIDVATDDDVFDSFGANLANTTITWSDSNNPNWFEQFTAVLNNAFIPTNPFGVPLKDGTVASIPTQLYRMNNIADDSRYNFSATAGGNSMDFEVCNGDFTDGGVLFERPPNPKNAFHIFYLNDGNGNNSSRTGFFLLFKQGTTYSHTFNIPVPVENQLLDLDAINVNENDVWVQTIDDGGKVQLDWVKVPALINANVTFNDLPTSQRNIFSVLTRDNDQISIRFSDGRFGNAPIGNILVTYRVSSGLIYQIKPLEINNITLSIGYTNQLGAPKTLTITFSLYENVANAAVAETVEQIRQRAPQVYATQNRMVTGEDYQAFPLSSNLAAKIKAVNRVYSGQSRYIDLHDPTGTYQDLSLFADDGILFTNPRGSYLEVPTSLNKSSQDILDSYLIPVLDQPTATALIADVLMQNVLKGSILALQPNFWTTSNADLFETTGWFSNRDPLLQPGAVVQFSIAGVPTWVAVISIDGAVTDVPALNTAGPVTLAKEVPTGSTVLTILPSASVLPSSDVNNIIIDRLNRKLSFSLWYDYSNEASIAGPVWRVGDAQPDFGNPSATLIGTQLLVMLVNYRQSYAGQNASIGLWQMNARGLGYIFESINDIEWFDNGQRGLAQATGAAVQDLVRIMRINRNMNDPAGYALTSDYNLAIDRLWLYPDGTPEPRRTTVVLYDSDEDGYPDHPDTFYKLIAYGFPYVTLNESQAGDFVLTIGTTGSIRIGQTVSGPGVSVGTAVTSKTATAISLDTPLSATVPVKTTIMIGDPVSTYLFWSNADNPPYDQPIYNVWGYDDETLRSSDRPPIGTVGFQVNAASRVDVESFWVYGSDGWQPDAVNTYRYGRGRGPNVAMYWKTASGIVTPNSEAINFHWKHYASSSHRLDPSPTNIHDIFVLTFAYDTQVRQWIAAGALASDVPVSPTELDLRLAFASMEDFKMFSDELVWRPVRYKFLFGATADPELQAQFKVVRMPDPSVSDGEIKSQIINSINTYFAVANWDFGETFYFTELAAYIHQQLAGRIGSVVLVPLASDAIFGDGFEVPCRSDEVFISTAQVSDIVLIPSNTSVNLRIGSRTLQTVKTVQASPSPTPTPAPSPTTSFAIGKSSIGGPDPIG